MPDFLKTKGEPSCAGHQVSKKFLKIVPIYRHFGGEGNNLDYSEESLYEMFLYESRGIGNLRMGLFNDKGKYNGYLVGKHWMDATVKMWMQDMKEGLLFLHELYDWYPKEMHWWLDKFVKDPMYKKYK